MIKSRSVCAGTQTEDDICFGKQIENARGAAVMSPPPPVIEKKPSLQEMKIQYANTESRP